MASIQLNDNGEIVISQAMSQKNENLVSAVLSTMSTMKNPFDDFTELISISSRIIPSQDVRDDIDQAFDKGLGKYQAYMTDCFVSKEKEVFDTIPMTKLKDFSSKHKRTSSVQQQKLTATQDRTLYSRLLVVSQIRQPDLRQVLSYNLSTYPLALASSEGVRQKAKKETLMHAVEKAAKNPQLDLTTATKPIALVVDAMALVRMASSKATELPETFGDLAEKYYQQVQSMARAYEATRIDWVADQYRHLSIKNAERLRRADNCQGQRVKITDASQKLPKQFTLKFLSNSENKADLLEFIYAYFLQKEPEHTEILVTNKTSCSRLVFCNQPAEEVRELQSNHEEADTRMYMHVLHAIKSGFNTVLVASPDTDVLIIGLGVVGSHAPDAEIGMITGTGKYKRIINISKVVETIGSSAAKSMPFVHALTGCDSVSGFYNRGKVRPLTILLKDDIFRTGFENIHQSLNPTPEAFRLIELFVCKLYGSKATQVNDARYRLYKTGTTSPSLLPPNDDALAQHVLRALYQAMVWCDMSNQLNIPSPDGHGWKETDGALDIVWRLKDIAHPQYLKVSIL